MANNELYYKCDRIDNIQMKIVISQQGKQIKITLKQGNIVDNYAVDKADEFLLALDRFLKKRRIRSIGHIGHIKFENTGVLTERIIRAIIIGLRF